MGLHTYRFVGASQHYLNGPIGEENVTAATGTSPSILVVEDLENEIMLTDLDGAMLDKDFEYVGAGDLRPAVPAFTQTYSAASSTLPAYTAPNTSAAYVGGLLDLLQAARLSDLNDLRTKLAAVQAHAEATAKVLNAVVDLLQARGIAS